MENKFTLMLKGVYKHFTGASCQVLDVVENAGTGEKLIVYINFREPGKRFVVPASEFKEDVEVDDGFVPRFLLTDMAVGIGHPEPYSL